MSTKQQWLAVALVVVLVGGAASFGQAATKVKSSKLKAQVAEPMEQMEPDEDNRDPVNPQKVKEVLGQITNTKRDIRGLIKGALKLPNAPDLTAELNKLATELNQFEAAIKNPPSGETAGEGVEAWWQDNFHEKIQPFRWQIQLPGEIRRMRTEMTRAEKQSKRNAKKIDPVIAEVLRSRLDEIKINLAEVEEEFNSGNYEEAQESLNSVHQGGGVWAVTCVGEFFYGLPRLMPKRVMNDPVLSEAANNIIGPVKDAVINGDIEDACNVINLFRQKMEQMLQRISGSRGSIDRKFSNSINAFEKLMQQKFESLDQQPQSEMVMPQEGSQPQQ